MKRAAVLFDLGFVNHRLHASLGRHPTAQDVHDLAHRCLSEEEELFRIYCYHCPPFDGASIHPLTKSPIDFAVTRQFRRTRTYLQKLAVMDGVAVRAGTLSFNGWRVRKVAVVEIGRTGRALQASDFEPDLTQKGVDMKVGLDVAWLASKRIVDRILLAVGDSDFVPAMKFARREGVQVVLVPLGHRYVKRKLREHADEVRTVAAYP